ncbi:MAG TPA: hypothetical protein VGQ19_01920 [Burkholderiales bacterium]|jgi:hypothetical protein|nr:hypothetical protein [Burkholderiales bacterium]
MNFQRPRYSKAEFARRGQAIYDASIRAQVESAHEGKFVAIDIETGEWEIDVDDYAATERLLSRIPDAQTWLVRVGQRAAYRIGAACRVLPR